MNKLQIGAFINALKKNKPNTHAKRKLHLEGIGGGAVNSNIINASDLEQNKPRQHKIAIKK